MSRERVLREFQRQRRAERAIGFQEIVKLPEDVGVVQGRNRYVAEQADLAILQQQPAQHLHAAEQLHVVDPRRSGRPSRHGRGNRSAGSACRPRCAAASSLRSSAPCAAAASPPAADRDRCGLLRSRSGDGGGDLFGGLALQRAGGNEFAFRRWLWRDRRHRLDARDRLRLHQDGRRGRGAAAPRRPAPAPQILAPAA